MEACRAASDDGIKFKRWKESLGTLLGSIAAQSFKPFSISIVPDELRKWNENAYMPKVVSMGPLYKGSRRELLEMQVIKWHCTRSLLERAGKFYDDLDKCSDVIWGLDEVVRASYVDDIKLNRLELATVMLLDGCFLLELLISGPGVSNDKLQGILRVDSTSSGAFISGAEVGKMEEVLSDMTLLENQIPLFILERLFEQLFPNIDYKDEKGVSIVKRLALSLLGYSPKSRLNSNAAHFLELAYSAIPRGCEENQEGHHSFNIVQISKEVEHRHHVELSRCATRLQAAGVTIKSPGLASNHQKDLNVVNDPAVIGGLNFDIKFSEGELEIPPLHITATMEAKWRNFIAWEHHQRKWKSSSSLIAWKDRGTSKSTWSALLFSGLICCADDVQLLKDRGIIVDDSKMSNQDLVAFFRSITKGVDRGIIDSSYSKMFGDLNKYSATICATQIPIILWHHWRRIPQWLYRLYKFLSRDYNFAATLVLVLTMVQACYAALSYHYPRK